MIDFDRFITGLGNVVLWSIVAFILAVALFEVLNRRYKLISEIFEENSVAAGIFAGAFVLGIFYTVTQIVIN
ncbi:MAG: hypothetical protein HYY30_08760 [Chloroflexi bacterium]|nr:hypothetical protein [Chloroflexota bacterium]